MEKKDNQKNKECPFCKISEESIDQLKEAGREADLCDKGRFSVTLKYIIFFKNVKNFKILKSS